MRRRHRVHVVDLAGRRALAVELAAVPGADAALPVRRARQVRHVVDAEHVVRTVRAARVLLDARHGVGKQVEVGRRMVAGPVVEVVAAALPRRARRVRGDAGVRRRRAARGRFGRPAPPGRRRAGREQQRDDDPRRRPRRRVPRARLRDDGGTIEAASKISSADGSMAAARRRGVVVAMDRVREEGGRRARADDVLASERERERLVDVAGADPHAAEHEDHRRERSPRLRSARSSDGAARSSGCPRRCPASRARCRRSS